jgi:predicted Zn-dependent peptidase
MEPVERAAAPQRAARTSTLATPDDQFRTHDLGGGLVALTEEMPGVRSVAAGVWVRFGSVHERPDQMGVAHMLEHMVFKGTNKRSARDIALVLERVGGSLDAYTTREHTSYQARVLDENLDLGLEVLADMVLGPVLRASDLELEREVILEEISTVEDTPDDLVFDLHAEAMWGEHPYGYSILGTRDTVSRLDAADLRDVHDRAYRRPNIIVAVAGSIQRDEAVERIAEHFAGAQNSAAKLAVPQPRIQRPREVRVARPTSQTHIVFGAETFPHSDPRRYAMVLLSSAFGGGMSSRLFQKVREEMGLAYAVYAYTSFYRETGTCGVYVGTRHEWGNRATDVIREELRALARDGLTGDELEDIKGQVKGQMVLALESSSSRLHRLAATALYDEPFQTAEEIMARVDAVTLDDIAALAAEYFDPERQIILRLGPE